MSEHSLFDDGECLRSSSLNSEDQSFVTILETVSRVDRGTVMKKSYIQLLSCVNVMVMVFCMLTIPIEIESIWGSVARWVAWGIIFGIALIIAVILTYYLKKEEQTDSQ